MTKKRFSRIALALCFVMCVMTVILATPKAAKPTPPVQRGRPSSAAQPATASAAPSSQTATAITEPAPPENHTAVIASTGDLMCHLKNLKAGYDAQSGSFDFTRFFRLVKPYLSQADYTLGNLETTLAEGEDLDDFSGYPLFKTPDAFAEALRDAGFDLLTTANNHMLDNGFTGLSRTLDVLDQLGLEHTGSARTPQEAQQYVIVEIQGIRFGFLAYTYPISIKRTPAEMKNAALNLFDLEKAKSDIAAIREAGAEAVLVSLHWGPQENNPEPSEDFRKAVKALLQAGADGVLGHHPHVLQPMEWVEIERDGETVRCPVLYSQGNFHCNPANEGNAESCISYLTFEKDGATGRVTCTDMAALPVYIYRIKTDPRDFVLIPIGLALDDASVYADLGLDNRKTLQRGWDHILASLGSQARIIRQ